MRHKSRRVAAPQIDCFFFFSSECQVQYHRWQLSPTYIMTPIAYVATRLPSPASYALIESFRKWIALLKKKIQPHFPQQQNTFFSLFIGIGESARVSSQRHFTRKSFYFRICCRFANSKAKKNRQNTRFSSLVYGNLRRDQFFFSGCFDFSSEQEV